MSAKQRVSANAILALKDALTASFWFKKDLYAYAKAAVMGEPLFLVGIGWTDPDALKRDSVSLFVDRLVREQDDYQDLLLALLVDVASMEEFPQLERTEDPGPKVDAARRAVARLRQVVKPYERALSDHQAQRDRIATAQGARAAQQATSRRLSELAARYVDVVGLAPQARGYALEPLLRDVFDAFDLDPKASFKVVGEQIDGGFTLDNEHFLLEARWENQPADRGALDIFAAKVRRRSDNTLGLFVAISGFERTAVDAHCGDRSALVLMDGADVCAVLEQRIDLRDLLRRKRRHAAMQGRILLTAAQILGGT
jgi:hypothetical protein